MDEQALKTIQNLMFALEILKWAGPSIGVIIMSGIGFVYSKLSSIEKNLDALNLTANQLLKDLEKLNVVRDQWAVMNAEMASVAADLKIARTSLNDVVILQRDQQTIWKNIDEAKKRDEYMQGQIDKIKDNLIGT